MHSFERLSHIMREIDDAKVVIVDGEEVYVVMRLSEYEQMKHKSEQRTVSQPRYSRESDEISVIEESSLQQFSSKKPEMIQITSPNEQHARQIKEENTYNKVIVPQEEKYNDDIRYEDIRESENEYIGEK